MFAALSELVPLLPAPGASAPAAAAARAVVISVILAKTLLSSVCTISTNFSPSFSANNVAISFSITSKILPSISVNSIFKSFSSNDDLNFIPFVTLIINVSFRVKPSKEIDFVPFTATIFDKSIFCPYLFIEIIAYPFDNWIILYWYNI